MRYISIALIVCLLALGFGIVGCSKNQSSRPAGEMAQQSAPPTPVDPAPEFSMKDDGSGHPQFSEVMAERLGVPIYPGSKPDDTLSSGQDGEGNTVMMASFTSKDSFSQVMAYYRKSLKGFTESEKKTINGSTMGGFRRTAGKDTECIVIEQPAKGPVKIAMTVSRAGKR